MLFDKAKLSNENLIRIFVVILLYILLGQVNSYVKNPTLLETGWWTDWLPENRKKKD